MAIDRGYYLLLYADGGTERVSAASVAEACQRARFGRDLRAVHGQEVPVEKVLSFVAEGRARTIQRVLRDRGITISDALATIISNETMKVG